MNKEKALEVIKEYLGRTGGGSLILDTDDKKIEWSLDTNTVDFGSYITIESNGWNSECECGEYYDDECEQCNNLAYYLLEKVEKVARENGIEII